MEKILDLIGKDQLEEAIEALSEIHSEINDTLKELVLLKSRLTSLNRDVRIGILSYENKELEKNKIRNYLTEIVFQLKDQANQIKEIQKDEINKYTLPEQPYPNFLKNFREVASPYFVSSSKSYLHLVFGDISKIENLSIAVGCSQDFDMYQSNPKSALGSLWKLKMNGNPLLSEIDKIWQKDKRPKSSGLGTSRYIKLSANSNNLEGVIFTVTTRDQSTKQLDKGLYTSTPAEGIPIVLSKVFDEAEKNNLSSLVIPLLGAGFANISRTYNNPELRFKIEKVVLAISIDESLNQFIKDKTNLERIVIVIYSNEPQSDREHKLWELGLKMLTPNSEKRLNIIDKLINDIDKTDKND